MNNYEWEDEENPGLLPNQFDNEVGVHAREPRTRAFCVPQFHNFSNCFSASMIFYIVISMLVANGKNENNCGNYMTWLKVILGLYIVDLLIGLNAAMQV